MKRNTYKYYIGIVLPPSGLWIIKGNKAVYYSKSTNTFFTSVFQAPEIPKMCTMKEIKPEEVEQYFPLLVDGSIRLEFEK